MSGRRKRVWLHPDSGLEGASGCLSLILTALLTLGVLVLFLCLVGAFVGGAWKFVTCSTGGDC